MGALRALALEQLGPDDDMTHRWCRLASMYRHDPASASISARVHYAREAKDAMRVAMGLSGVHGGDGAAQQESDQESVLESAAGESEDADLCQCDQGAVLQIMQNPHCLRLQDAVDRARSMGLLRKRKPKHRLADAAAEQHARETDRALNKSVAKWTGAPLESCSATPAIPVVTKWCWLAGCGAHSEVEWADLRGKVVVADQELGGCIQEVLRAVHTMGGKGQAQELGRGQNPPRGHSPALRMNFESEGGAQFELHRALSQRRDGCWRQRGAPTLRALQRGPGNAGNAGNAAAELFVLKSTNSVAAWLHDNVAPLAPAADAFLANLDVGQVQQSLAATFGSAFVASVKQALQGRKHASGRVVCALRALEASGADEPAARVGNWLDNCGEDEVCRVVARQVLCRLLEEASQDVQQMLQRPMEADVPKLVLADSGVQYHRGGGAASVALRDVRALGEPHLACVALALRGALARYGVAGYGATVIVQPAVPGVCAHALVRYAKSLQRRDKGLLTVVIVEGSGRDAGLRELCDGAVQVRNC